MNTESAIATIIAATKDPSLGLPDQVFYYISQTTPLINVDLLIRDENGRVLLSWRDDQHTGRGWHLPGGIVRFKETIARRIAKVAKTEIGTAVDFDAHPVAIHQMIHKSRDIRGHFISFLYNCFLAGDFVPANIGLFPGNAGFLAWHEICPHDLLPVHNVYRQYIDPLSSADAGSGDESVYISPVILSERGSIHADC